MTLRAGARQRFRRLVRAALWAQRSHPRRTITGALALALGTAAVVVMASISAGAERRVLAQVRALGTNLVVIQPAVAPAIAGRQRQQARTTTLRPSDAALIAEGSTRARATAPALLRPAVVSWGGRNVSTALLGTTVTGLEIQNIATGSGRLFDGQEDREQRRVAVLGATVAHNLFGSRDPVGQLVLLGRVPFEIVGVMRRRGTDVNGADLDNMIAIPLATAMRRVFNVPFVDAVFVQGHSSGELPALERDAIQILRARLDARSGVPAEFTVRNQAVLLRTERGTTAAFRRLMLVTAAAALIAGALTVMATMLLAVRERVVEIALRRAVGARIRDVQVQFLVESATISILGGATGAVVGIIVAAAGSAFGRWDVALPWLAVLGGIAVPSLTGVIVGVVPAIQAARLDPGRGIRMRA